MPSRRGDAEPAYICNLKQAAGMTPDLTDDDKAILAGLLREAIEQRWKSHT